MSSRRPPPSSARARPPPRERKTSISPVHPSRCAGRPSPMSAYPPPPARPGRAGVLLLRRRAGAEDDEALSLGDDRRGHSPRLLGNRHRPSPPLLTTLEEQLAVQVV